MALKLALSDDLRRVTVEPSCFSFEDLRSTIGRLFASELSQDDVERLAIKYLDDENDLVTVRLSSLVLPFRPSLSPSSFGIPCCEAALLMGVDLDHRRARRGLPCLRQSPAARAPPHAR